MIAKISNLTREFRKHRSQGRGGGDYASLSTLVIMYYIETLIG